MYITISPGQRNTPVTGKQSKKEIIMNTRTSTQIIALTLALLVNGTLFGGIALLFSAQPAAAAVVARAAA
jgi:hypothetical protein